MFKNLFTRGVVNAAVFACIALTVSFLASASLFLGWLQYSPITLPWMYFEDAYLGFKTKSETAVFLNRRTDAFLKTPLSIVWRGEHQKILPEELGIVINKEKTINSVSFIHSNNNLVFLFDVFHKRKINIVFTVDSTKAIQQSTIRFSQFIPMRNAQFAYDSKKKTIITVPEQRGSVFETQRFLNQLNSRTMSLKTLPLFLKTVEKEPEVTIATLEQHRDKLLASMPGKISFAFQKQTWEIIFPQQLNLITYRPARRSPPAAGEGGPIPIFEKDTLINFFREREVITAIERQTDNVTIYSDENGTPVFEGKGIVGRFIDYDALLAQLNAVFTAEDRKAIAIDIPTYEQQPKVTVSDDLKTQGIKELIGVGYSTYYGSPANRIHNIGIGVRSFNGVIFPKDTVFSFNDQLGVVDASTGYRKELVIKADGTKPEFGGGLCQVSTTMYRAALNAGLPIIQRKPHSYAVTYYAQAGGHGLDATIYPGVADLQFLNDTPGDILIQAYTDGLTATFNFYGTKDNREVAFEGPYIGNHRKAPPEELIYTTELPVGERRKQENPHNGFDATWYRILKKDGQEVKETIFSRYQALPAKILVGGTKPADEQENIELEAARAFE